MITINIQSEEGVPFKVTFQGRCIEGDTVTWKDLEEVTEIGKSQCYGLDENFRLIVATDHKSGPSNG